MAGGSLRRASGRRFAGGLWKTCGRMVDIVCTAVDATPQLTASTMLGAAPRTCARSFAELFACAGLAVLYNDRRLGIVRVRPPRSTSDSLPGPRVQRIEQQINGRLYYIELSQVQRHRWRAHVVTAQGAPTALMPFYDDTADAAAQRLAEWLARLHRPSAAHA